MPRLMTMVVLLAVIGLMIVRARDESTWQWLVDQKAEEDEAAKPTPPPKAKPAEPTPEDEAASIEETDLDPEQVAEAAEEFQAITDGTLTIQPEEMFAYGRVFNWVQHQSFETLWKRANGKVLFNDLFQHPNKWRGKLVRLKMNVRRVIRTTEAVDRLGVDELYEIWGFTDESKAWLFCVITPELPKGIREGTAIEEQAKFAGYFLKLEGYHEAGAKPNAPALKAPVMVGRMTRIGGPTEQRQSDGSSWVWAGLVGLLGVFFVALTVLWLQGRRTAARKAAQKTQEAQRVHGWLGQGDADETLVLPGEPGPRGDSASQSPLGWGDEDAQQRPLNRGDRSHENN